MHGCLVAEPGPHDHLASQVRAAAERVAGVLEESARVGWSCAHNQPGVLAAGRLRTAASTGAG